MSWIIRRMISKDIDGILALEQTIPEAPHWNRAAYESCATPGASAAPARAAFIAEADGCLLGFSVAKVVAGICELESIAVAQEMQGQGIGRALFDVVTNWAHASEAARLELEVRASNSRAIKFYELAGMRREGLRAGYYHSPDEDAVLMGTTLPPGGKLV